MIELNENSYIVGIWYSENPGSGNWLCCVIADPDKKGFFKGWSRTRITNDDKIFDSTDEKRWLNFDSKEGQTEDQMIETINVLHHASAMAYNFLDKIMVKGDLKKLMKLSKDHHWMHMKEVKK